jgi:hypothetical protein
MEIFNMVVSFTGRKVCSGCVVSAVFCLILFGWKAEAAGTLMQRTFAGPVIPISKNHPWRAVHVANAAILSPEESPDGLWRLYLRGSGYFPDEGGTPEENYHDSLGLFFQEEDDFSPLGPWTAYEGNPILVHGPKNAYDGKHLLDCAPVWGEAEDGSALLVMLYKGVSYNDGECLAGACSSDGMSFDKYSVNPMQRYIGPCDVIFYDERYYIFYGDAKYDPQRRRLTDRLRMYLAVVEDPVDFENAPRQLVLDVGPAGAFDSRSVHGGRIFQLKDRWYMVYQCSSRFIDYPDRFHVAWSDDLIRWMKVENDEPFFERGEAGAWDEGGIWYGDVFEHKGTLYMYYEGWGSGRPGYDRGQPYMPGGRSQTGLASVSVRSFLKWCKGK